MAISPHERLKGGRVTRLPGLSQATSANPRARQAVGKLQREIRSVDDIVVQFHSRPVRWVRDIPGFEAQLPGILYPVGSPIWVRYDSDKDDPVTRPLRERDGITADPAGVQGVVKPFIHQHTPDQQLQLYDGGRRAGRSGAPLLITWPGAVGWLGTFQGCEYRDHSGQLRTTAPKKWDLWCFPDARMLMAIPDPRKGKPSDVLVWKGGRLNVNWRGIEH